ncbi:Crp/Fnr family transcriptional regulator [Chitinophaga pinensis]|uniref:Transcriptional regulator, Crp/Fnr family n=1 Tax=Chitinophaga pinensis (strain ATCC 43595 / DSM 2588 / LMG 13176 / NBRC 15968 / NCIMB 11800 / UQM 2034) TaxID=485918 RepID=A0A979G793_CHIPD|nr:Crp/Fnr family transcriptional regulator [Chitinophaga pinensis]ACU62007.1 putative transcriptional regulator, Crp/Fnr family [Chitinophaga pinensis DSM 2588]
MQNISATETLRAYFLKRIATAEEDATIFAGYFEEVRVKKGQYIVQPGFTARYKIFVLEGAVRAFVLDKEGNDHTISLAIEEWWITDVNSFVYQQPATMYVVALEDSRLLQISHEKEAEMRQVNPLYEAFFRMQYERSLAFLQRRIITNLTLSAEERYLQFQQAYPSIAARVPLYALASYLGMTRQFLSRIRNKQAKR